MIRAACAGQGGKLGFGVSLPPLLTLLLALPCGNVGQAQHAMSHYIGRKGQLAVESATSPQHSLVTV